MSYFIPSHYLAVLLVVHPTCESFIRQTEETLFQSQSALKISQAELKKLENRQKMMEILTQEGAISLKQWEQFQGEINRVRQEILEMQQITKDAKTQINTLRAMARCKTS